MWMWCFSVEYQLSWISLVFLYFILFLSKLSVISLFSFEFEILVSWQFKIYFWKPLLLILMLTNNCRPIDRNSTAAVLGFYLMGSLVKRSLFCQASWSELFLEEICVFSKLLISFPCQKHFRTKGWAVWESPLLLQFVYLCLNCHKVLGFGNLDGKLSFKHIWENCHQTDKNVVFSCKVVSW